MFASSRTTFRHWARSSATAKTAGGATLMMMMYSVRQVETCTAQKVTQRAFCHPVWKPNMSGSSYIHQQQQQQPLLLTSSSRSMRPRWTSTTTTATSTKATTPPPPATTTKSPSSFVEWYEGHLSERPVPTKMVTGAILWGLGDGAAQLVPVVVAQMDNSNSTSSTTPTTTPLVYDWSRTARAIFFGFAIHAPTAHVHYNFLEWLTVRAGVQGLAIPVFKAVLEQFVYWSWISNTLYHGAMGAMQGHSLEQIYKRLQDVLWETQKAQWVFWIPVQLLNFRFVPVRHQLNVVLLTSVVWTALLSAWYPPEEEGAVVVEEKATTPSSQEEPTTKQ